MTSQPVSSGPRQFFAMLRRQLFGRGKPRSSQSWNESFAKGEWAHLDDQRETPRFAAPVCLIVRHDPGTGGILDVGCAPGRFVVTYPTSAGFALSGQTYLRKRWRKLVDVPHVDSPPE